MSEQIRARGQAAKNLLNNPDFQYVVDAVKRDVFEQFVRTNYGESEKREDLFKIANAMELLKMKLEKYVSNAAFTEQTELNFPADDE